MRRSTSYAGPDAEETRLRKESLKAQTEFHQMGVQLFGVMRHYYEVKTMSLEQGCMSNVEIADDQFIVQRDEN